MQAEPPPAEGTQPAPEPSVAPPGAAAVEYASLGRRLLAGALDLGLGWVAMGIAAYIAVPELADDETLTPSQETAVGVAMLITVSVWLNYMVISEWRWGKTLGKAALGIEVVNAEGGRRPSWNRSLARNLLRLPDLVAVFLLVPGAERHQRLGDRAGRTVVVRSRPDEAARGRAGGPSPATGAGWGPTRVLLGFGVLLLVTTVGALVAGAIDPDLESLEATLLLQATLALGMAMAAFLAAHPDWGLAQPRELGLGPSLKGPWRQAVVAYLVYIGCAVVLSQLLSPEQEDVTRELGYGQGWIGDVAAALLIVLAAPVTEEIFFRGFFFAGVRARTGFLAAAIISSAVWGLFHYTGSGSWPVVLQLAIFGVILCWLYERTGSIRATIVVHALNNAIAFAVLTSG